MCQLISIRCYREAEERPAARTRTGEDHMQAAAPGGRAYPASGATTRRAGDTPEGLAAAVVHGGAGRRSESLL